MTGRIDERLLDRYLVGDGTPAERAELERWTAARPENGELLAALRTSLDAKAAEAWDVDAAWALVTSRMAEHAQVPVVPPSAAPDLAGRGKARAPRAAPAVAGRRAARPTHATRAWTLRPALIRAAAVLVLALGAVAIWRGVTGPSGDPPGGVAFEEYTAPVGSTRELRLADGSQVTLAPASRLLVHRDLSERRDVSLEGEAFFRVTHMPERPFRVRSNGSVVRVLGTEFDVRTGPGSDALMVAVASGRVSVGSDDRNPAAVLEPGQMALLDSAGTARVSAADLDRVLAWTRGLIELDNLTLSAALLELERWYDADLEVTDPALASRRVSASFRGEPIDQVLASLALALSARVERDGRRYRVVPDATPR